MFSKTENITEDRVFNKVAVWNTLSKRVEAIEERIKMRSKMSAESKSDQSWKDEDTELKSEMADLKSMMSKYKKWYDAV